MKDKEIIAKTIMIIAMWIGVIITQQYVGWALLITFLAIT